MVLDRRTRKEIGRIAWEILQEAGIAEPPVSIVELMDHLDLNRSYYDLKEPGIIDKAIHKAKVGVQRMLRTVKKSRLLAVLFYDDNRIVVDESLPELKRVWPTYHETAHRILPWHETYFIGDTAQTLNPDWREQLEAEANYGASSLMFCGPIFARDARDTKPCLSAALAMKELHKKTITTTMRRYVEFGPRVPMALLVSTPYWKDKPEDQEHRWRHFVTSPRFRAHFTGVQPDHLLAVVDKEIHRRGAGPVGEFAVPLTDSRGEVHDFRGQTFNNSYYLLTLFVQLRRLSARRIVLSARPN